MPATRQLARRGRTIISARLSCAYVIPALSGLNARCSEMGLSDRKRPDDFGWPQAFSPDNQHNGCGPEQTGL